ncbi:MAG: hypothetical protein G01um101430_180 [Parcubacteria group bacterium Gr01-1014_30]|nr:MAG: hypothetical protein G01um101430_180 [Parcubacteria group bacterium Gr01-1014_30]
MQSENSKLKNFRKKYQKFIYNNYSYRILHSNLEVFFDFKVEPDIKFKPKIVIKNVSKSSLKRVGESAFENLVFHLGLVEIPSYWKATCSPIIEIRAGYVNREQISFWKDLLMKGMGQFFYENKIDFTAPDFLTIKSEVRQLNSEKLNETRPFRVSLKNKVLVPVGGGKDSVVTLEQLKKRGEKIGLFLVNPKRAAQDIARMSGIKDPIIVRRKIDPALLELNKKGFLNGHTPFTALLSFYSCFAAVLFGYKNIAFANEKSADEGNLRYLGTKINHQWSKSSEFERKFRKYLKNYLVKNINYFSFLRKYTELEIAKMFTKYPQYFSVFSSCNRAEKWCGSCPKCLFIYAVLYPYLGSKTLLKIFGKNVFNNKKLFSTMKSLIGQGSHKPFECVGTFAENKKAFELCLEKAKREGRFPYLLECYNEIRRT